METWLIVVIVVVVLVVLALAALAVARRRGAPVGGHRQQTQLPPQTDQHRGAALDADVTQVFRRDGTDGAARG